MEIINKTLCNLSTELKTQKRLKKYENVDILGEIGEKSDQVCQLDNKSQAVQCCNESVLLFVRKTGLPIAIVFSKLPDALLLPGWNLTLSSSDQDIPKLS